MSTILIPVDEDKGRQSVPNKKFGSSPYYLLINSEDASKDRVIQNTSKKYGGTLPPIKFILELKPDYVFTTHACENALKHMNNANVKPYLVNQQPTKVLIGEFNRDNLKIMKEASH